MTKNRRTAEIGSPSRPAKKPKHTQHANPLLPNEQLPSPVLIKTENETKPVQTLKTESPPAAKVISPNSPPKALKNDAQMELILLGDVTVRFTKSLLAYGAENNWEDVKHSAGRSLNMEKYRSNWRYISKKNHLEIDEKPAAGSNHYFFHNPIYEPRLTKKNNHIARKATTAVLAHSGSCDEHAYVSAMLLMKFLPLGTKINICYFLDKDGHDFKHTFVVIGDINAAVKSNRLSDLILVDAWVIAGGALPLIKSTLYHELYQTHQLKIDYTLLADGKDHLIKRVIKQQKLLNEVDSFKYVFTEAGNENPHHSLVDQKKLHTKNHTMNLMGYEEDDKMWKVNKISPGYKEHPKTSVKMLEILNEFSDLKKVLVAIDDDIEASNTPLRKGSGFI